MRGTTRVALSVFAMLLAWAPIIAVADTFILSTGEQVEGKIVQARTNVIAIRLADGYLKLTYLSEIRKIQIPIDSGDRIEGKLLDWSDGVTVVSTGGEILQVRDGKVLANMTANDTPADDMPSTISPDAQEPDTRETDAKEPDTGEPAASPSPEATPNGPKESFLQFLRDNQGTERAE